MTHAQRFDLVETMAFDPQAGVGDLDRHLERLGASAEALGFAFDPHLARNELQAATFRAGPSVVRLRLSPTGAMAIALRPAPEPPAEPVAVARLPLPLASGDVRLAHSTSDRAALDEARARSGAFEAVFHDEDGFLTRGSFTTIFVERGGRLLTPPLARARLPGVLRGRLLEEGKAEEADLAPADLADGFLIGSSARGLLRADLA